MLPDPEGPFSRYLNRGLQPLSASAEYRARILLAEPGLGKTYELRAEAGRLRRGGAFVAEVDLGAYGDAVGLREAFRRKIAQWNASIYPEIVFALDAFDEPLSLGIAYLADLIEQELEDLDRHRLRVLVASRASQWSARLESTFTRWWGPSHVVRLTLAPLTRGDVELAATAAGQDPDRFIDAVARRGVGAFAARPSSLTLLLAGSGADTLPATRAALYERGVQALAAETTDSRRVERRQHGPAASARIAAARRLATVTLLTGRRTITRRFHPEMPTTVVALDTLTDAVVGEDALDAIYDSALLSGGADARTWTHHSIEEFLAAAQLARLPLPAAIRLLTVPGNPGRLVPQLRETAAWLAWLSPAAFDWLLRINPQVLTGPDLQAAPLEARAAVATAVIAELRADAPLGRWQTYYSLAFDGLADLLRPLLDDNEPAWRRREALVIISATGERGLDTRLIDIIERTGHDGPHDDDTEVTLAETAVAALVDTRDTDIHLRLKVLLGSPMTPVTVRASIIDLLWPTVISTAELLSLIVASERFRDHYLRQRTVSTFTTAIDTGQVAAQELVEWFSAIPDDLLHSDSTARLAARVARAALSIEPADSPGWKQGADLARRLFDHEHWSTEDIDALGDSRRRHLARDILTGGRDILTASTLQDTGVIQQRDLGWWFDQLAEDLAQIRWDGGLSARMVIELLLTTADPEQAASIGDQAAQRHPALGEIVGTLFAPDLVQARHTTRPPARSQKPAPPVPADPAFDLAAFTTAVGANDFAAALRGLRRHNADGTWFWLQDVWAVLDSTQHDELVSAALSFLSSGHDDEADLGRLCIRAHEVLRVHKPDALRAIPRSAWFDLLPHLVTEPGNHAVLPTAVAAAGAHDSDATAALLAHQLSTRADGSLRIANQLGTFRHVLIGHRALELLTQDDLEPDAIGTLLWIALSMGERDDALTTARNLVAEFTQPSVPSDAPIEESTVGWSRTVDVIAAVMASDKAPQLFDDIMTAFRHTTALFAAVTRTRPGRAQEFLGNLTADQLAELHLWARETFPARRARPGVTIRGDSVEDSIDGMINILLRRRDLAAAAALRTIATTTSNVWLGQEADQLRDDLLSAHTITPEDLIALLAAPDRRLIRTATELAELLIDTLGKIAQDLPNHGELLWDRIPAARPGKSGKPAAPETWRPKPEAALSNYLAHELTIRLTGHKLVINREVLIHPRNAYGAGDKPDILVQAPAHRSDTTASASPTTEHPTVAIEVKPSWSTKLTTSQRTQLACRYLPETGTNTGIYIVGSYPLDQWTALNDQRKTAAKKVATDIHKELVDQSQQLNDELGVLITPFSMIIPRPHTAPKH
jgi:hypothetical protein